MLINCWPKSKISWNPELSHNMQKEDKKHYCPFTISGWKRGGGVWGDLLLLVMYSKFQMAYCQLRLTKAAQLQATVNFSCAVIAFVLNKTSSLDFQKLSRVISLLCNLLFCISLAGSFHNAASLSNTSIFLPFFPLPVLPLPLFLTLSMIRSDQWRYAD